MKVRWHEFLNVALVVASDARPQPNDKPVTGSLAQENAEARYRIETSRAYYAAIGVCREYIRAEAPDYPLAGDAKEHTDICKFFAGSTDSEEKEIGEALFRMKEARRQADYDLDAKRDWKTTATDAFEDAEKICQRFG